MESYTLGYHKSTLKQLHVNVCLELAPLATAIWPCSETPLGLQIMELRLAAHLKLGSVKPASDEAKAIGDFAAPKYQFESYPALFPVRRLGSPYKADACFYPRSLRVLRCVGSLATNPFTHVHCVCCDASVRLQQICRGPFGEW
jgi:hypothetical protein